MKDILNALKNGNGVERLSIIANILSILGVSIAAFVASIASLNSDLSISEYIQISIIILLGISALLVVIGVGLFTAAAFEEMTNGARGAALILKSIVGCLTIIGILFVIDFSYHLIFNTFFR